MFNNSVLLDVQANLPETSPFLPAQMALVSTFFQMIIVLGMYNFWVEEGYCTKISSSKLQLFTFVDWLILLLFSILHKWPFQQFETIFIIYSYCINKIKLSFSKKATKNFRYLILYFLKLRLINVCSVHNFDTKFTRGGQKYVHFHSIPFIIKKVNNFCFSNFSLLSLLLFKVTSAAISWKVMNNYSIKN